MGKKLVMHSSKDEHEIPKTEEEEVFLPFLEQLCEWKSFQC